MKRSMPKFLKQFSWLPAVLIGMLCLLGLVGGIALGQFHHQLIAPAPAPTVSPSVAAAQPVASPSPKINARKVSAPPSPSPQAKTSQTQKASTPTAMPTLNAQQQAINEQYKDSVQSSMASIDTLMGMRVAIAEGVPSLSISTSATASLLDNDGNTLHTLAAGTAYSVQSAGESITINSWDLPRLVWVEPSPDGLFYLGDRGYRGRLLLATESGKLWAVNFINMRSYLQSVVPSEVSASWNVEALKAQAVAARSYALTYHFRPVSSIYDMGDDERYQVYSGVAREAEATNRAVDATAGEFVSYRGGIVESLYAASDDIVSEAFQGRGMSQLGALSLAERGYRYQQILANYYPGTGIGRIQAEYE